MSDHMESEEIKSSRGKTVLFLLINLAFALLSVAIPVEAAGDRYKFWLVGTFFGLGSVVCAYLLIRPQRLLLSPTGFTLSGGLVRSPKHWTWREVGPFFVYQLQEGGTMVGFNFAQGARQDSTLVRVSEFLGAEGALPGGWQESTERMVERLNAFRDKALAQDAEAGAA